MRHLLPFALIALLTAPAFAQHRAPCGPDPVARELLAESVVFDGSGSLNLGRCGNRTMRDSYVLVIDVEPEGFEPGDIFRSSQLRVLSLGTQILVSLTLLPSGPPLLVNFASAQHGDLNRIAIEAIESPEGVRLTVLINGVTDFSDFAPGKELSAPLGPAFIGEDFDGVIGPIVLVDLVP